MQSVAARRQFGRRGRQTATKSVIKAKHGEPDVEYRQRATAMRRIGHRKTVQPKDSVQ